MSKIGERMDFAQAASFAAAKQSPLYKDLITAGATENQVKDFHDNAFKAGAAATAVALILAQVERQETKKSQTSDLDTIIGKPSPDQPATILDRNGKAVI